MPEGKNLVFLYDGKAVIKLSGSSRDIRIANRMAGLKVNAENAIDYMTFFAENIGSFKGSFHIVQDGDVVIAAGGKRVEIEPPVRIPALSLQKHFMRAMMYFSGSLHHTIMFCDEDGTVSMLDDAEIEPVTYKPKSPYP